MLRQGRGQGQSQGPQQTVDKKDADQRYQGPMVIGSVEHREHKSGDPNQAPQALYHAQSHLQIQQVVHHNGALALALAT